jgi:hypothetical protein
LARIRAWQRNAVLMPMYRAASGSRSGGFPRAGVVLSIVDRPRMTARTRALGLALAAATTVVLWQFAAGRYLLYPFTILATWFHEMGHGLVPPAEHVAAGWAGGDRR